MRCPLASTAGVLLALASAAGCRRGVAASIPIRWSTLSPGLDVATSPLADGFAAWAVRFDQRRFQTDLAWSATGLEVPGAVPPGFAAVVNGGYFEPDLKPSGLLIDHGREVHVRSGGSGALVIDGGRLDIVRIHDLDAGTRASVVQAWPFLIEPGGANGIRGDDGKRSRRSAVALDALGRGIFVVVPQDGVTLLDLMRLCRSVGAVVAVNLDGGPSTGFALGMPPGWMTPSETPVSNALVVRPRH